MPFGRWPKCYSTDNYAVGVVDSDAAMSLYCTLLNRDRSELHFHPSRLRATKDRTALQG